MRRLQARTLRLALICAWQIIWWDLVRPGRGRSLYRLAGTIRASQK